VEADGIVCVESNVDSPSVRTMARLGASARSPLAAVNWLMYISLMPPEVLVFWSRCWNPSTSAPTAAGVELTWSFR